MKLSKNFSLEELIFSVTANNHGFDNTPNAEAKAAVGLGFGMLFELSSIVGHIAAVKGVHIKLDLKKLIVAIIKKKNEDIAEILDEGIEEIEDNRRPMQMDDYGIDRRHYGRHGDCTISPTYDDDTHHCGEDANDEEVTSE